MNRTYLGDGLYAVTDGDMLTLRANGHDRAHGMTDEVHLEPAVWHALIAWIRTGAPDYNSGETVGMGNYD